MIRVARLLIALPLVLGLIALAAGSVSAERHASTPQLIGFDEYYEPVGYFEATQLERLDPVTLRSLPGRPLKLHDYAESWILGPDGRTLAIGGYNYGELIFVDIERLAQMARLRVAPRLLGENADVHVVSWPRRDRILAVVSSSEPGPRPISSRLAVVDTVRRRVVRTVTLDGNVVASLQTHGGRAVFLVSRLGKIAPARLVTADADGHTRTVTLTRILAGCEGGGHCGGQRWPALVSDGRRAFVVGGREPIASVDLRTLGISYHEVPRLMVAHLPVAPSSESGSGGPQEVFSREACWLGKGRLLVTGSDEFPAPGLRARWVTRAAAIVDTRAWRLLHVFRNIGTMQPSGGILLGSGRYWVGQREVGPSLVAFRSDGRTLYRRSRSDLSWNVVAGRLFVGKVDGTRLAEVNLRTGRPIRSITRPAFWPLDVLVAR